MARRYTPPNQKQKDAQRTKQLENRLYLCGLGEVNMTRESIKAAEIWLKKLKIRTITTTIKRAGE